MTKEERNIGIRWFEEVWNKGRRDAVTEMLAENAVLHDGELDSVGPAGFYPFFDRLNSTLSEIQVTVHDSMAEGDRVCVRWSTKAKHTGPGLGIAPTGKSIQVTGITIIRVLDGMAVEAWQNWDMLGLLEQIRETPKSSTYVGVA